MVANDFNACLVWGVVGTDHIIPFIFIAWQLARNNKFKHLNLLLRFELT